MRPSPFTSRLKLGLLLSVFLHAGVGFVAATLPLDVSPAAAQPRAGLGSASLFTFDPSDPAKSPRPTPPSPDDKLLSAFLVEPEPPLKPLTPEEIERILTLGISESDQRSPNWMGFANPTEHKAQLSSVEQPQLDPNPGTPGAPSLAGVSHSTPQVPLPPSPMPADAIALPADPLTPADPRPARDGDANADPSKPTADKPRDGASDGSDRTDPALPRDGNPNATGTRLSQPNRATLELSRPNPNLPGPPPDTRGHNGELPTLRPDETKSEFPRKIEPVRAMSLPQQVLPQPQVPAARPPDASANNTPTPTMPTGGPTISTSPGNTGERPGDKSPKEADASSTTPTIEIRPGHPAAAQGLNISTKRPNFTRYVRVTAWPLNPLVKLTFNHLGVVTKVVVLESSGVPDVDGPVVNAAYQWSASGKELTELTSGNANAEITLNFRVILK